MDNTVRMRPAALILSLLVATSVFAASKRHAVFPELCTAIVSPASLGMPAEGGPAFISVMIYGGCKATAVTSDPWITATPSFSQTTGWVLTVNVAPNKSATPRTGIIHMRSYVIPVTQSGATNLLQNGSFDTDLSGWSTARNHGLAQWVNGTAVMTSGEGVAQLDQCVNVEPSTRYEAGAKVFIPSGQNGVLSLAFFDYSVPNCDPIGAWQGRQYQQPGSPIATWFDTTIDWTSNSNAKSVLIAIGADSASGPFTATFDDVYLRKTP